MNGASYPDAIAPPAPLPRAEWMGFLDDDEWLAFSDVVCAATQAGLGLLVGGALGLSAYMPLNRHTKDIDFYILPGDREPMARLLARLGFEDIHERMPYDRAWIYRAMRREVIVDLIWSFPNRRAEVDAEWFRHSHPMPCGGVLLRAVAPEELIRAKLFVFQRERCDWPDLLNLLYYAGPRLDWDRLRRSLGPDAPLLEALLTVFGWVCPERELPGLIASQRADLLDSRAWFLPVLHAKLTTTGPLNR
jgi:hypothetical protein